MKSLLLAATLAAGATPVNQGFYRPSTPEVAAALKQATTDDSQALASAQALRPTTEEDRLWQSYIVGLAYLNQKKLDEGYASLISIYDAIRAAKEEPSAGSFRILGAALKKVGWIWRQRKEFEKAYAYHSVEFDYYEAYGSPKEIHDACISLDVDSFSLNDFRQSEKWLRRSIVAAEAVTDAQEKAGALGMSYNNLAGSLYSLHRFEESVKAIETSFTYWQAYEALAGQAEHRVTWAYFGVGDVFEQWAIARKAGGEDYSTQKEKGLAAYRQSLERAQAEGVPAQGQKSVADRIAGLAAL